MKRNLFFALLLICGISFLTSCSDDDDKKSSLEGTYTGQLIVSVGGKELSKLDNQNITLTEKDETHYTLELKNFKFNDAIVVPLIQVNTTITEDGKISGEASDIPVIMSIKADVTISGTVISNQADLIINVSAPLTEGANPIEMLVKFNGKKK